MSRNTPNYSQFRHEWENKLKFYQNKLVTLPPDDDHVIAIKLALRHCKVILNNCIKKENEYKGNNNIKKPTINQVNIQHFPENEVF